jgi:LacI family transcriptional regulator
MGPTRSPVSRATIKDVARLSGVSTATVTRALQGSPRVLPETRQRVQDAAAKLGYRPDSLARALVTGSSKTLGLIVPSSGDPFWGEITEAFEDRAAASGFSLLLGVAHADPDRERRMLELFHEKRVDGLVVAAPAGNPGDWPHGGSGGAPLVLVSWDTISQADDFERARTRPVGETVSALAGTPLGGDWAAHVAVDDVGGAAEVVRHLISLGHERIDLLAGPPLRPALLRMLGYRLALEEAGLPAGRMVSCDETFEAGRRATAELLAEAARPTAIVAYNDVVAIGAINGARRAGLAVPADISIAGYDDIDFASYVDPALTTLRQPKREMGVLAMDLLLDAITTGARSTRRTLSGELVVRGTTGPVTVRG